MFRRPKLETKSDDEVRLMRRAGLVVAETLEVLRDECRAGMSTGDLDRIAEETIRAAGAQPSFPLVPGYRHTLCVSVNEQVVHGIPGDRRLQNGDLVSIDCGAVLDGWHGDAAISLIVGGRQLGDPDHVSLMDVTERALWAGIAAFRVGGRVGDIGAAVEDTVTAQIPDRSGPGGGGPRRYGIVREYEGHGIGRAMHMSPGVPNHRSRDLGPRVGSGATVAIEPMVTLGSPETVELDDDWTVVTADGCHAAHWEHTVAVTHAGLWVLTSRDGGEAGLAAVGARYAPLS